MNKYRILTAALSSKATVDDLASVGGTRNKTWQR